MDAIFNRRSIRRFADRPVEAEKVEMLMRAAMQAPSAGNQQPWHFVVVDDRETLEALSHMSRYAGPLAGAALGVITLARSEGLRFAENWQQDMGAATENILLEAVELGLGGVWLAVEGDPSRGACIREVLGIPEEMRVYSALAIGYPAETPEKPGSRFDPERVHHGRW